MIRILGCSMILGASTAIGYMYGENLKKRTRELKEIERCIIQLQNEIVYTHTPLPEAIMTVSKKSFGGVKKIFEDISKLLMLNKVDSVYEAFNKVIDDEKKYLNLKDEDLYILLDMSKTLGESDIQGQKKMFLLTLNNFKSQIEISENLMNSNVKMYRYLGFALGAMTVIVLI
ncbi:stage III sporulation protein SpoAB [Clostridium fermenticellae]|uniref:Stage III sporulation protein SpoAB n=1 Tax=Clostridium fermenticellae TaxID=2068654 RepID=A0A386H4K1_9CLOT|nr:stage III sporulation protein SpoIIIAB [Clostridium fermenticellae]AYD40600.1 stage III sporulation protein SpoAB [Clostridium fermenticellae]